MIAALAFRSDLQNEREPAVRSSRPSLSAGTLDSIVDRFPALALRSPPPECKQLVCEWERYADKRPDLG